VDQHFAEQLARHIGSGAAVKGTRQDGTEGHSSLLYNGG
jgi:hypothetical protein